MALKYLSFLATLWLTVGTAGANSLKESFLKLPPEERAHQACIVKGMDNIRRDKRFARADRIKSSILTPALFEGTLVTAKGAALRSEGNWYALEFTCNVAADFLTATSFIYDIGPSIPRERWEDLGLWE